MPSCCPAVRRSSARVAARGAVGAAGATGAPSSTTTTTGNAGTAGPGPGGGGSAAGAARPRPRGPNEIPWGEGVWRGGVRFSTRPLDLQRRNGRTWAGGWRQRRGRRPAAATGTQRNPVGRGRVAGCRPLLDRLFEPRRDGKRHVLRDIRGVGDRPPTVLAGGPVSRAVPRLPVPAHGAKDRLVRRVYCVQAGVRGRRLEPESAFGRHDFAADAGPSCDGRRRRQIQPRSVRTRVRAGRGLAEGVYDRRTADVGVHRWSSVAVDYDRVVDDGEQLQAELRFAPCHAAVHDHRGGNRNS